MRSVIVAAYAQGWDGCPQNVGMHATPLPAAVGTRVSRRSRALRHAPATGLQLFSLFDDDGVFETIGASYGRAR